MEIQTIQDAAAGIADGATIAMTGSGGGLLEAEALFVAIEDRFVKTGHPRGLTLVHALGIGGAAHDKGTDHFAHNGMVKRIIGGHWAWSRRMQDLVNADALEAYCFPAGVISLLLREIGAGRPGLFTHVGLGTFADPAVQGGRINNCATETLVERCEFDGRTVLRYKPFAVDIGIVRGSFADPLGNLSARREPVELDALAVAAAAHSSGGRVIAQVRETVAAGALSAREIFVPGVLVDTVVVDPGQGTKPLSRY